jgi:very-short-patch-repair endonuclease
LGGLGQEGVSWAWSFVYAMLQGAVREFAISPDDVDPVVLTSRGESGETVAEVMWVDTVVGGSGILQAMTKRFPDVADAALRHLDGHDCPSSCYRCLRSYRNQRLHDVLSWRIVVPQLQALAASAVECTGDIAPNWHVVCGPEWDEARAEGCESPQELRLLRAIRQAGLPEPVRQHEVTGEEGCLVTRADFAYPDHRALVYVDGLAFHSSLRQRLHDSRQTGRLQAMGWKVLRFVGPQVQRDAADCAGLVRCALDS